MSYKFVDISKELKFVYMPPDKTVFTEEEYIEFLKSYATNNYLFGVKEIDGKIYYIKLN